MRTKLVDQFKIDVPIFAFSHCRDVVAAVTKAGGMGVLGAAWMTPEEFEMSLKWLDRELDGKPYGVDLVFPGSVQEPPGGTDEYLRMLPETHKEFADKLLDQAGAGRLPDADRDEFMREFAARMAMTPQKSEQQLEIALSHPVSFVVGALGVTPRRIIDAAHSRGMQVGALVGSRRHAIKQRDAGVDVLVAQGTEAGGSVGSISSTVLWPQVVEAVAPLPVLAAGGVGRGSQILSALAMGAAGVWMGSVWLGTKESELTPEMKQRLFEADSEDAVISYSMTGKQGRMTRSRWTEAWEQPGAPEPLKFPLQSILLGYPNRRAERSSRMDHWTYSVGQIVGDMKSELSVRQVFEQLLTEYVEAVERLKEVTG